MSMRVVITDNKSGKVLVDHEECNCIIGAFSLKDRVNCVQFLRCSSVDLAGTVEAVQNLLQKLCEEHPEILILGQMKDLMKKLEGEMGKR